MPTKYMVEKEEWQMEQKEISEQDRQCISNCIHKFWNLPETTEIEGRDGQYEQCLTDCEICS